MTGDGAISTSSEIVSTFSLPGPFSLVCKAIIPATCVVNVGLCKRLFASAAVRKRILRIGTLWSNGMVRRL
jgi:hypothetical protein